MSPPEPHVAFTILPDGYAGTVLVVAQMRRFAIDGLRDERIHQLARTLTAGLPSRDGRSEAEAILRHLQPGGTGGFRYVHLPWDREGWGFQRVQHPSYTLFASPTRSGECASLTVAYAALARALGHEVRFRTAGRDARSPYDLGHVYALDDLAAGGPWTAADPSYDYPLGWPHRPFDLSPVETWSDWLI